MSVSIEVYGHSLLLLLTSQVDFTALKLELLDNTAVFDASHVYKTNVDNAGAYEVYGNAWPIGGLLLGNVTFTQSAIDSVTPNDCVIDADDVIQIAAGGTIGPSYKALVYDSISLKALFLVDFGQVQTAGDTTPFKVVWPANGIFNFIV